MEYNFSFLNLAVWFMIIQSCTGDLLLYKSAQETEPPVSPSDISGWAWLGSGQWVDDTGGGSGPGLEIWPAAILIQNVLFTLIS